jgi:hypothetical protein
VVRWPSPGLVVRPTTYHSIPLDRQAGVKRLDISIFLFHSSRIGISSFIRQLKSGLRRRPAYRFMGFAWK